MKRHRQLGSKKQLLAVIILLQLSWCPIWGLIPHKKIDQYLVDKWDMEKGIPSNSINSIAQTPDGYLWIATAKGLVRFDGIKFSTVPFIEKEKNKHQETIKPDILFTDKQGTLWIGSSAGLSYHFENGQFKTFTGADGLTRGDIRCIKEDMKGNLWIGFRVSYVNRFSNGEFTAFNASQGLGGKKICAIVEDRKGNLLFGSRENGVFKYRDNKFSKYPVPGLENLQITTMEEDWQGGLWIGATNGLFRVTDKGIERYTAKDGLTNDFIMTIREDSDRNLWVGTRKGLNRVTIKQDGTVGFETLLKLKSVPIMCLFEDREKNLWVGTDDSGIWRLKNGKFISYAPFEEYKDAEPVSVFENRQGDTWVGAFGGKLFRCRGSNVIETLEPPELSNADITAIGEDADGNLWLGTIGKGVFQRKKGTFIHFTNRDGLADNTVTSIYKDSRNNLWFSTFDGVSVRRYAGGVFESFTSREGLSGKKVHNVYEDKNQNIWIGADKGITVLKDGKLANQNAEYYLRGISTPCIYEDPSVPESEGSVYWIATESAGLKRLSLKDKTVTSYTTAEGMTTNCLYQIFEDQKQGNFWLTSDSGILRVKKSDLNAFASGEPVYINCVSYGISDGMKSIEFHIKKSKNSALQTGNRELWFVTTKGISIVNLDRIIDKMPPPVVIEEVFFDRQSIPLHQGPGAYRFKGKKDFSVQFTAPTLISPEKVIFKFRLEGFEKEWVYLPAGKERIAEYQNLDYGTYTFRVTACNAEGIWNKTGASRTFTLEPFFHQTLVFKLGIFILIALLLATAVYIYMKRPFDKKRKSKDSPLHPHFIRECLKKLDHLIEKDKVYCDESISLESLAKMLSIPSHQLSQILNHKLKKSFPDFINYHRIEEVKRILESPRGSKKKITTIGHEVGFNSMTSFYKAFRKHMGMRPSEYKVEVKKRGN